MLWLVLECSPHNRGVGLTALPPTTEGVDMTIRMSDFRVVKNEVLDADGIPSQEGEAVVVFPLPKRGGNMGRGQYTGPAPQIGDDKATLLERYASRGWAFESPDGVVDFNED